MSNFVPPNTLIIDSTNLDGALDSTQFGFSYPTYTWRKGGTDKDVDNHLYLFMGNAQETVKPEENVLIEVIPETKEVKFYGKTTLNGTVSFDKGQLNGEVITPKTITSDLLEGGIAIDGTITALARTTNIDGIDFNGTKDVSHFGICTTETEESHKEVTINGFNNSESGIVSIQFTNPLKKDFTIVINDGTKDYGSKTVYYANEVGELEPLDGTDLKPNRIYEFSVSGSDRLILNGELNKTSEDVQYSIGKVYQEFKGDDNSDYPILLKYSDNLVEKEMEIDDFAYDHTENSHRVDEGLWNYRENIVYDTVGFGNLFYNPRLNQLTLGSIKTSIGGIQTDINKGKGTALVVNSNNPISGLISYTSNNRHLNLYATRNGEIKLTTISPDEADDPYAGKTITLIDNEGKITADVIKANLLDGLSERAKSDEHGNNIVKTYLTTSDAFKTFVTPNAPVTFTQVVKVPSVQGEENTQVATVGYVLDTSNLVLNACFQYMANPIAPVSYTEDDKKSVRDQIGSFGETEVNNSITEYDKTVEIRLKEVEDKIPTYTGIDGGDLDVATP